MIRLGLLVIANFLIKTDFNHKQHLSNYLSWCLYGAPNPVHCTSRILNGIKKIYGDYLT